MLLCLGGGRNQVPLIRAARAMGCDVVEVDKQPVSSVPPDRQIYASTWAPDTVIARLRTFVDRSRIRGLLIRTSGPAIRTAARLDRLFGCNNISLPFAEAVVSKSALLALGPVGEAAFIPGRVATADEPVESYPSVVKPDQPVRGKANVYLLTGPHPARLQAAADESVNARVVVMPWLDGIDITAMCFAGRAARETLLIEEAVTVRDGRFHGLSVSWPSPLAGTPLEPRLTAAVDRLMDHFELEKGIFCFSFRVQADGGIFLYEVNAGLGGDSVADDLLPAVMPGFDPYREAVRLALGEAPRLPRPTGVRRIPIGREGDSSEYEARLDRFLRQCRCAPWTRSPRRGRPLPGDPPRS